MRDYYKDKYKKLILSIDDKLKKRSSENSFLKTFQEITDLLEIGRPSNGLERYFSHPSIIKSFLYNLLNTDKLIPEDRLELHPLIEEVVSKIKSKQDTHFVRYRILAPGGIYPNLELGSGRQYN